MGGVGDTYTNDDSLVAALRRGDEHAFEWMLGTYDSTLRRVARNYVPTDAIADEVVQDTWIGVIRGIDDFEQRSSLKTWLYRILLNIARTKGVREKRTIPFSSAANVLSDGDEPTFDPERFRPADTDRAVPGRLDLLPAWPGRRSPKHVLESSETVGIVKPAIAQLPPAQREVLTLRDIEGWTSSEVCNALDLTETNQRVLLHRARARVRRALELYFEGVMAIVTVIENDGIPCQVFVELVTEYLEGALPADEVARIDAHLALCPGCVSVVEQFRETVRLARQIREDDVDRIEPSVRADLMAAFREAARHRGSPD